MGAENAPLRYDITVSSDRTELDILQKTLSAELKSALPDADIAFSGNAETLVLTGKVANPRNPNVPKRLLPRTPKKW